MITCLRITWLLIEFVNEYNAHIAYFDNGFDGIIAFLAYLLYRLITQARLPT